MITHSKNIVLASGGYDCTIRFWDVTSAETLLSFNQPNKHINAIKLRPHSSEIYSASYEVIKSFDYEKMTKDPVVNYTGCKDNITHLDFTRNGNCMITLSDVKLAKIWDLRKDSPIQSYHHENPVTSLRLHHEKEYLLVGDDQGLVTVWDVRMATGVLFQIRPGVPINSISIDQQSSMLALFLKNGYLEQWYLNHPHSILEGENFSTSSLKSTMKVNKTGIKCDYSPDSTLIAISSTKDSSVTVFETVNNNESCKLIHQNQDWVWDFVFNSDSEYMFTASSDGILRLWQIPSSKLCLQYIGHSLGITSIAFKE